MRRKLEGSERFLITSNETRQFAQLFTDGFNHHNNPMK